MSQKKVLPWAEQPLSRDELACIYGALILVDDDIPVTSDKILTLLKAADIHVEPVWPTLFARALQGINARQLVASSVTAGGKNVTSGDAGAVAVAAADVTSKQADKKEEAKKVEEEEDSSDEDMGLGLFD